MGHKVEVRIYKMAALEILVTTFSSLAFSFLPFLYLLFFPHHFRESNKLTTSTEHFETRVHTLGV